MLLAAGIAATVLAACASAPQLTFDQQVAIACGGAQGEIAILKADNVFTGGAADTLTKDIEPAINKVCKVGATVTDTSLQSHCECHATTGQTGYRCILAAAGQEERGRCGDRYRRTGFQYCDQAGAGCHVVCAGPCCVCASGEMTPQD
ncbi:hypothetical protein ACTJK4_11985 [Ralstonia sp. 22111]